MIKNRLLKIVLGICLIALIMFFNQVSTNAESIYDFGKVGNVNETEDIDSSSLKYTDESQFDFNEKTGVIRRYTGKDSIV